MPYKEFPVLWSVGIVLFFSFSFLLFLHIGELLTFSCLEFLVFLLFSLFACFCGCSFSSLVDSFSSVLSIFGFFSLYELRFPIK